MIKVTLTHGAVSVTGHLHIRLRLRDPDQAACERIAAALMPEFQSELEAWAKSRRKR